MCASERSSRTVSYLQFTLSVHKNLTSTSRQLLLSFVNLLPRTLSYLMVIAQFCAWYGSLKVNSWKSYAILRSKDYNVLDAQKSIRSFFYAQLLFFSFSILFILVPIQMHLHPFFRLAGVLI